MKANIGLSAKQRDGVVALLNATLADEYVLYTKTRNYHWNVTGPHFNDLNKFFESQYEALDRKIDEIAEFVRYRPREADTWGRSCLGWTRPATISRRAAAQGRPYPLVGGHRINLTFRKAA